MFRQVFHEDFRRTVRSLPRGHPLVAQICHCLLLLKHGHWKGGTRVKQLDQGRGIFEARINDGHRLLFAPAATGLLLIYDVVGHDAVNRTYRRMRTGAGSPAPMASAPNEPGPADDVIASLRAPPQDGPDLDPPEAGGDADPWGGDYVSGSIPRMFVPRDEIWSDPALLQGWCDRSSLDVDLLLTEEQEAVTRLRRPVLLHGSAGSGKTTVIIHSLHEHAVANPDQSLLYVTYHPGLRETAEDLYQSLLAARALEAGKVTFYTFDDLCRALLDEAGLELHRTRLFGEAAFVARYPHLAPRPVVPATAAWCEIRGVIKGRIDAPSDLRERRLLGLERYLGELGRCEGAVPATFRRPLWELARTYQGFLDREGWHDEMDLARLAWHALAQMRTSRRTAWRFDAVFCDEVQDLTALQMSLLHDLWAGPPARLFLAGDAHQTIHPSAFRWAEVSKKFYEGEEQQVAYDRVTLARNFRNSGQVLALAEAVLTRLKRRLLQGNPEYRWEPPPLGSHQGPPGLPPVRIEGSEAALVEAMRRLPASAQRVVIAGSDQQRAGLQERLGEAATVVTVHEFKGLEADCVILWSFFSASPRFWSDVVGQCCTAGSYEVLTECNRLYVALTRSRRYLALYDPSGSPVPWELADFRGVEIRREAPAWLLTVQKEASSQAEWLERALLYEKNRVWRLAAVAYRHGGRPQEAGRCLAALAEEEMRLGDAGRLWLEARQWERARACFKRMGDARGLARCEAEETEARGDFRQAAEAWERSGDVSREALAWARAAEWERAKACMRAEGVKPRVRAEIEMRRLAFALERLDAALRRGAEGLPRLARRW